MPAIFASLAGGGKVRCPWPTALLLCLATAAWFPALGDEPPSRAIFPGESASTARRLTAADRLLAEGRTAEAAEEFVRLLDEAGSDLVPVTERHSLRARWLIHQRLAALPAEALRAYRSRIDGQAKKWLDQAAPTRDVRLLRRIVEEAFCSRPAEAAIDLLGDLAFERGDFAEAERWWRLLARPASEANRPERPGKPGAAATSRLDLVYPDPQGDVARVRARQILAQIFAGRRATAAQELDAFRARHAQAAGALAGRSGPYAQTLQELLEHPPQVAVEPADEWPTFGGDGSRGRLLPAEKADPNRLLRLCRDGPAWRFRLDTRRLVTDEATPAPRGQPAEPRLLAYHPVIVGPYVFVADHRGIVAVDVRSGAIRGWDLVADGKVRLTPPASPPAVPDLRFTLTAADGRLYARFGAPTLGPDRKGTEAETLVACVELPDSDGKLRTVRLLRPPPSDAPSPRLFEGAPLVQDGLIYMAATRFAGAQAITSLSCYTADHDGTEPRWTQDIFADRDVAGPRGADGRNEGPRARHQLLTAAGPHVVACSHAGAVVAVDALTGRRAWAVRYPSGPLRPDAPSLPRDLAPCLYAEGRVYVAPNDYDALLCLDPMTGQLLWQAEAVEVQHLLGVGSGRLIFSTRTGLRAVNAEDGSDVGGWQRPDLIVNEVGLPSQGRGFLAGDLVVWPTRDGVKILRQEDGLEPEELVRLSRELLPPGHMAYANDCLAVCDDRELFIYLAPGRLLPRREGAVRESPNDATLRYRLALAEADAGLFNRAEASYQQVAQLAGPGDRWRGEALRELAQRGQHEVLLRRAEAARQERHLAQATALLERAAATEFPAAARREALLRRATEATADGRKETALAAWKVLQNEPALRRGTVRDDRGRPQSVGVLAAEAIRTLEGRARPATPRPAETESPPPELTLPLLRAWESPPNERFLPLAPGPPDEAAVYLVRDDRLVCRSTGDGREQWTSPLGHRPTWAGRSGEVVVVAGPDGVSGHAADDGQPLWEWMAPESSLFLDRRLSEFQITAGIFCCMQGRSRLLGLEADTGRVLWVEWAPSARFDPSLPDSRLSASYFTGHNRVLVHAPGQARLLDAATGNRLAVTPAGAASWDQPPVRIDPHRIVSVADPRRLVLLDTETGQTVWSRGVDRPLSLSGERPLLSAGRGGLVVFVPRNYATTLQRLDVATGASLWPDEVLVGPQRLAPGSAVVDEERVCYATGGVLTTRGLSDGRQLWRQPLPDGVPEWRLVRASSLLLVFPSASPRRHFSTHWGTVSLELTGTGPPEDRPGGGIPVLLFDVASGDLVQRLNLQPPRPGPEARLRRRAWTGRPAFHLDWQPTAEWSVDVQFTRDRVMFSWNGKAWALRHDHE